MSHDASVEQQMLATIDKWVEQELRPSRHRVRCGQMKTIAHHSTFGLIDTIRPIGEAALRTSGRWHEHRQHD